MFGSDVWAGRGGNKRFFYFHDILIDLIIKRGRKVEEANCSDLHVNPMGICRIWCEHWGVGKLRYHRKLGE